ncbi:VTT domain-containing protein [Nocardia sp. XZ_19_385]|uniref:DedA family protein n=1 Tax=Nocardia sp. XZ_19_385 TaxID=2769488 RepID=UPI00188FEEEA|nr:VTT domain-containing protein [Nocardia sp. XZ_19_385]
MLELVEQLITSPWIYLLIAAMTLVDGFIPVPSEAVLLTAGAYAATGAPEPVLVIAAAASGAFAGDHISYQIGRVAGGRIYRASGPDTRRRKAMDAAARELDRRGGVLLIAGRSLPAMRNICTLTAGAVGYSRRSFAGYDAIAALYSATAGTLLGVLGGQAFRDEPWKGALLGIALAVILAGLMESFSALRKRRKS